MDTFKPGDRVKVLPAVLDRFHLKPEHDAEARQFRGTITTVVGPRLASVQWDDETEPRFIETSYLAHE